MSDMTGLEFLYAAVEQMNVPVVQKERVPNLLVGDAAAALLNLNASSSSSDASSTSGDSGDENSTPKHNASSTRLKCKWVKRISSKVGDERDLAKEHAGNGGEPAKKRVRTNETDAKPTKAISVMSEVAPLQWCAMQQTASMQSQPDTPAPTSRGPSPPAEPSKPCNTVARWNNLVTMDGKVHDCRKRSSSQQILHAFSAMPQPTPVAAANRVTRKKILWRPIQQMGAPGIRYGASR
jgi:hypothetical protein